MKKALIIGVAGFVGSHLIDHIQNNCIWSITVTKMPQEKIERSDIDVRDLNIMNKDTIVKLLKEIRPDYIFHLAAQGSVGQSWKDPGLTVDVNIKGSLNVLDAIRELDYKPRILLIGSSEEYGRVRPDEMPIREEHSLHPGNVYAATKACQGMLGQIYCEAYEMDILIVRAFTHVGPNQPPLFVVADFCKQIAEIEKGLREPVIRVGNLNVQRDFSDVRDVVYAYTLLMEHGTAGEIYNVGSGKAISIQEILKMILSHAQVPISVEVDTTKLRPVDVPIIEADVSKLIKSTGWTPKISIQETIVETLNYWRKNMR